MINLYPNYVFGSLLSEGENFSAEDAPRNDVGNVGPSVLLPNLAERNVPEATNEVKCTRGIPRRSCSLCRTRRPLDHFVEGSARCTKCRERSERNWKTPDMVLKARIKLANKRVLERYGHASPITVSEWTNLCRRYYHKCAYCGISSDRYKLTIDHFVPLLRGGEHDIGNILPACSACNARKGTKLLDRRPKPGAPIWEPKRVDTDESFSLTVPEPTPKEWDAMTDAQRWISVLDFPKPRI